MFSNESDYLSATTAAAAATTATTITKTSAIYATTIPTINIASSALSQAIMSAARSTQSAASVAATYIGNMLSPYSTIVDSGGGGGGGGGGGSSTAFSTVYSRPSPATFTDNDNDSDNDANYENLVYYPDDLVNNEFVQIFFGILYTTVFVLGVFGNVLVCYVVLRNRAMQTVTNIFITNLALSDILLCILGVPFTPLYTFMGRWAFGRTLCHLVSFAQGCSIYISTLTLTSIAIDRYFVIIYPFHPRMKLSTCIAIIISIWVIALLATLPYGMYVKVVSESLFIGNGTHTNNGTMINAVKNAVNGGVQYEARHWSSNGDAEYIDYESSLTTTATEAYMQLMTPVATIASASENPYSSGSGSGASTSKSTSPPITKSYCEENWPSEQYRKVFGSVTTILQFVLPFIIISICYTWVSIKLNARARAKPGSKSSRREEADRDRKKRTNRMLIAMVAVFGLSWLPINVVNIFDDFYVKSHEWRFYNFFFFIAHSIAMSSTCYNPFLYAWLNENFRKEFKHVLPCFNPSNNNNILNIARGYNRSERNTCGPRLRHGSVECGIGAAGGPADGCAGNGNANDENDDNGITQETTCLPRERLLIIPREPTYGNGSSAGPISPQRFVAYGGESSNSNSTTLRHVEISLNESGSGSGGGGDLINKSSRRNNSKRKDHDFDEVDSADEQTIEMRFCETPFINSETRTTATAATATATTCMLETNPNNVGERNSINGSVGIAAAEESRTGRCN